MAVPRFNQPFVRTLASSSLIVLALAFSLSLITVRPAQANLVENIRRFFGGGNSGSRPSGRSRGGAIRDEACTTDAGTSDSAVVALVPEALPEAPEAPTDSTEATAQPDELLALQTVQKNPSIFLYVPFDRSDENLTLVFELAVQTTANSRTVLVGPMPVELPPEPGIMSIQLPDHPSLETGKPYEWTFRLLCHEPSPEMQNAVLETSPASDHLLDLENIAITSLNREAIRQSSAPSNSAVVHQEIFGNIVRVERTDELVANLAGEDLQNHYLVYAEHGLWLEMLEALAADPLSEDWLTLLENLELPKNLAVYQ